MARTLTVEILGDAKSLERAFGRAETKMEKFGSATSKASKVAAVGLAALAFGAFKSIQSASGLEEAQNKVNVVFEKSAGTITAWSKTTADGLGISRRAALAAAGGFGDFFQKAGQAEQAAAGFSMQMVKAAADMASFHDADPTEVLEALRSGLSGEAEPLRRFGIFMSEATIKTFAYKEGIAKAGTELTENQKILARQGFILANVGKASGDFARTSEEAANAERRANAVREDTVATLGSALLPAYKQVIGAAIELIGWTQRHEGVAQILAGTIGTLAASIILLNASLSIYNSRALAAIGATNKLKLAVAATPWGLAALAVSGLVVWLISQRDRSDEAAESMNRLKDAIQGYHDAISEGKAARGDLEDANLRLDAANLAIRRSRENLTRVERDGKATTLELGEANLAYRQALRERERAADNVTQSEANIAAAMSKARGQITKATAEAGTLAQTYRTKLAQAAGVAAARSRGLSQEQARANVQLAKRELAAQYADRLRDLAKAAQSASPSLARTARTAALLADAWGRVVSLPAAREFVARFRVITTIEENRLNTPSHRASGGPVAAGMPYVVGERGPELFVPRRSGTVVPNAHGGGGVAVRPIDVHVALNVDGQTLLRVVRRAESDYDHRNGGG